MYVCACMYLYMYVCMLVRGITATDTLIALKSDINATEASTRFNYRGNPKWKMAHTHNYIHI